MQQKEQQDIFMELLEPVYGRLERFVLAMTHNRELARDIIHDTVAAAWQQFDRLRHREAFLSYLFTIAARTYKAHRQRQSRTAEATADFWDYICDTGTPPDVRADYRALYEALDKLPEQQREAVVMFELLGFSMKEIQQVQGGTLVSVKVRISRGRKKLAHLLGVHDREQTGSETGIPRTDSVLV